MTGRTDRRHQFPYSAGLALLILAGCGGSHSGEPATVPVSGTLAVEGKPVVKGTIHFQPEKGRPATGIVKDGKFTLTTYSDGDGGIAGPNKIAIDVTEDVATPDGDTTAKSLIPDKFRNPDRSGVTVTIPAAGFSNVQVDVVGNGVKIKEE